MKSIRKFNDLAAEVTRREGGKQSLGIGQVSEVLRVLCDIYGEIGFFRFACMVLDMRRRGKKRLKDHSNQMTIDFREKK